VRSKRIHLASQSQWLISSSRTSSLNPTIEAQPHAQTKTTNGHTPLTHPNLAQKPEAEEESYAATGRRRKSAIIRAHVAGRSRSVGGLGRRAFGYGVAASVSPLVSFRGRLLRLDNDTGAKAETLRYSTHTNTHAGQSISTATGVRDRDREIDTGEEEADKGKAKMSDEDYAAFLEKANRDPSEGVKGKEGVKGNGGKIELRATDGDGEGEVPRVLRAVVRDRVYVSDADEPFVGVSLKVEGGLPDECMFSVSLFFLSSFLFFFGSLVLAMVCLLVVMNMGMRLWD